MIAMRALGFSRFLLVSALAVLALLPSGVRGQLRTVVSSEIAVSEREATLRLDFLDEGSFAIEFHDGRVLVDGEQVGTFGRRDALDSAWRSLLGEVITLEDGPLAQALVDWAPPAGLSEEWAKLATHLDRALETTLALPTSAQDPSPPVPTTISREGEILTALLGRPDALSGLAEALEGISMEGTTLLIGEDMVVEAGDEFEGTLILVDGDLEVAGTIDGDVVLTGGVIRILDGGRVTGDLRVADGEVERLGGSVGGSVVELAPGNRVQLAEEELAELKKEMEELREEKQFQATMDRRSRGAPSLAARAVARVSSAIGELLKNFMTFLVLCVMGVLMVHFQGDRLEVVATTARRAPTRSAVVGLAGGFLLLPVWIVGAVALLISIIGIPVFVLWVPFFPVAAGLATLLGVLAVARNVGEWVADQEYKGLEWIRGSNSFYTVIAGIGALMLPWVASNLVSALGVGPVAGLLAGVGYMITLAAATVGLGAVLLTRGGRIRPHESYFDFEDEFWMDAEPPRPEKAGADSGSVEESTPEAGETEPAAEGDDQPSEEGHEAEGETGPEPDDETSDTDGGTPDAERE
jgi:hypothetical protein